MMKGPAHFYDDAAPSLAPVRSHRSELPVLTKEMIASMLREIAKRHGLSSAADVLNHDRRPHCVKARAEFAWRCRVIYGRTASDIGRYLKRDHSTILELFKSHPPPEELVAATK